MTTSGAFGSADSAGTAGAAFFAGAFLAAAFFAGALRGAAFSAAVSGSVAGADSVSGAAGSDEYRAKRPCVIRSAASS
ncbi:Uncharacterised protein [Mycobacteroides abscessus subsp. abscessus]|nr:Uncharacterised protein [Mycobacteroides abscessus subsp. abscessus]